jgi:tellurite resistance protein
MSTPISAPVSGPVSTRSGIVIPAMVLKSVDELVARLDAGDYNPTPVLDLGVLVAHADGVVDAKELDALRSIFEPLLGAKLDREVVGFLVDAAVQVIESAGIAPRIRVLSEILLDCDAAEPALVVALAVAFASEGLSEVERATVASLAKATDVSDARLGEIVEQVRLAFGA